MKVLVLHNQYRFRGGEDAVVERESRLLEENGFDVASWIVSNDDIQEGALWRSARNSIWNAEASEVLTEKLVRFRPEVVHIHNVHSILSPAVVTTCVRNGVPVVQTLHNYRIAGCISGLARRNGATCTLCIDQASALPGTRHRCYRDSLAASTVAAAGMQIHRAKRTYPDGISRFIAPSQTVKDMTIRGGIAPDAIDVIPHYVSFPWQEPLPPGTSILFAGRLVPEKGIQTLMEAWPLFNMQARLTIVGTGPLQEEVAAWAGARDDVTFLGEVPSSRVRELMREARLTVVPSEWLEPFGLTAIESLSVGTPIVTSDLGGVAEIASTTPAAGTFRAGDPASLRHALEQLFEPAADPGLRLRALSHARSTWGPDRHVEALREVYMRVQQP